MTRAQLSEQKFSRLTAALSVCEEFSHQVRLHDAPKIVTMIHKKWIRELELRLNQVGWRLIDLRSFGPLRIVTAVDRYR
jgi:hypothetical protein